MQLTKYKAEMDTKLKLIFDQFQEYYAMSKELKEQLNIAKENNKQDVERKSLAIKNIEKMVQIDKKATMEEIKNLKKEVQGQMDQQKDQFVNAIKKVQARQDKDYQKSVQDMEDTKQHCWDQMKQYVDGKVEQLQLVLNDSSDLIKSNQQQSIDFMQDTMNEVVKMHLVKHKTDITIKFDELTKQHQTIRDQMDFTSSTQK